jgi:hypothetical protein
MRRVALFLTLMVVMAVMAAGIALADFFTGTNDPDRITGTGQIDQIAGSARNDTLRGVVTATNSMATVAMTT